MYSDLVMEKLESALPESVARVASLARESALASLPEHISERAVCVCRVHRGEAQGEWQISDEWEVADNFESYCQFALRWSSEKGWRSVPLWSERSARTISQEEAEKRARVMFAP